MPWQFIRYGKCRFWRFNILLINTISFLGSSFLLLWIFPFSWTIVAFIAFSVTNTIFSMNSPNGHGHGRENLGLLCGRHFSVSVRSHKGIKYYQTSFEYKGTTIFNTTKIFCYNNITIMLHFYYSVFCVNFTHLYTYAREPIYIQIPFLKYFKNYPCILKIF